MIEDSLFNGSTIQLTFADPEQDYEIESAWSYDLDYALNYREMPVMPLAPHELKKHYEKLYKEAMEGGRRFHFAIRLKEDNRLVGFVSLRVLEWNQRVASIVLAVGDVEVRPRVEAEALALALVYAFDELNMHRVDVSLPEYDHVGIDILQEAGFQLEVRRKEGIYRHGKYWDWLKYGLLVSEWQGDQG
jgi:RimJ/RimL family protein N-acetyltransferase